MRLMWIGTYEGAYPRTRVLVAGLGELGVGVVECHRPVWERIRHKAGSFLAPAPLAAAGARFAVAWPGLALEERRAGPVDAVVAGYPCQPDALPASLVARRRRVPLVVDAMVSLADTLAGDRGRAGSLAARALAGLDRAALGVADLVVADTRAGARFLAERFGVRESSLVVAPVGAEPERFPPAPPPQGPPHALFYGKLAPLHGVDVVLAAARRPGVPPVRLIGDGQLGGWLREELARERPAGLVHEPWVSYERLGGEVAAAAMCLGVFGTGAKASRVVPNKVWQAMAVGRPVVTADSPAAREVLSDGIDALLVPPGDPAALAVAMARLASEPDLRARMGAAARRRFLELGAPRAAARPLLDALAARLGDGLEGGRG